MISLKSNKIKALAVGLMLTLALGALGCGGDKKEAGAKAETRALLTVWHLRAIRKVRTLLLTSKMLRLTSLICRTLLIAL